MLHQLRYIKLQFQKAKLSHINWFSGGVYCQQHHFGVQFKPPLNSLESGAILPLVAQNCHLWKTDPWMETNLCLGTGFWPWSHLSKCIAYRLSSLQKSLARSRSVRRCTSDIVRLKPMVKPVSRQSRKQGHHRLKWTYECGGPLRYFVLI